MFRAAATQLKSPFAGGTPTLGSRLRLNSAAATPLRTAVDSIPVRLPNDDDLAP